jgi:uncharacterized membrane protein
MGEREPAMTAKTNALSLEQRRDLAQLVDVLLWIAQHDAHGFNVFVKATFRFVRFGVTRITADERAERRLKRKRVEERKLGRAISAGW